MLKVATLVFAMLLSPAAFAQIDGFAPLRIDISPEEAMVAAPDIKWIENRHNGVLVGVSAASAIRFAGDMWNIDIGNPYPSGLPAYPLNFNMTRDFRFKEPSECEQAAKATIAALEPVFGPFGRHRDFAKARSRLYGGLPFQLASAGTDSRLRIYPTDTQIQDFTTFAETDEASGASVMIIARRFDSAGLRICELRVNAFTDPARPARASPKT